MILAQNCPKKAKSSSRSQVVWKTFGDSRHSLTVRKKILRHISMVCNFNAIDENIMMNRDIFPAYSFQN